MLYVLHRRPTIYYTVVYQVWFTDSALFSTYIYTSMIEVLYIYFYRNQFILNKKYTSPINSYINQAHLCSITCM